MSACSRPRSSSPIYPSASEAFLHLLRAGDAAFHGCESNLAAHNLSQGRFTVLMLLMDQSGHPPHPVRPPAWPTSQGSARVTMEG